MSYNNSYVREANNTLKGMNMDISQMYALQNKLRFNLIVNSPFPFRLNRMAPVSISQDEIIVRSDALDFEVTFRRNEIGDMTKPQLSNFHSEFLINGQWV